jgi:basic membrane protein A
MRITVTRFKYASAVRYASVHRSAPTGRPRIAARRAVSTVSALALALGLAACGRAAGSASQSGGSGKKFVWTMVTDQAGLGDHGFNDLAKQGIDTSAKTLGGRAQVIQSSEQSQYVPNLQQAVAGGATVTTGVGFLLTDSISQVAQANPKAKFVLIDATATDKAGKPLPNVASVTFKEQQAAFLAGIISGMTTKTKKLGFIGGINSGPVTRFLSGFEAGVKEVDPQAHVNSAFLGNFTDSAKAKELANGFADAGADVVMESAGAGGVGVFDAAKALGAGHWVVSTDTCKQQLAPQNYLTSATKDVAGAVVREDKAAADGTFKGGLQQLGLEDNAVGVCDQTFSKLPANIQANVNKARAAIKAAKLTVPETPAQAAAFTPVQL